MLVAAVTQYTRDVEAFICTQNKHGLKHRPKTIVEVGLLLVDEVQKLNRNMAGMYDIMRSAVCIYSLFLSYAF